MSRLDDVIKEALSKEDAEFVAKLDQEPNSFRQMADIFQGPLTWMYWVFLIVAVCLGIFGVYSGWRFAFAVDLRSVLHWGGITALCVAILAVIRILFFMQMHTNRVLRELKRLELQLACLVRKLG